MIIAVQGGKLVLNGNPTDIKAPETGVLKRYMDRLKGVSYEGYLEYQRWYQRVPEEYPILMDGRVLMYVLTSRPGIGYTLKVALELIDPELDEGIMMAAVCPQYWGAFSLGGVELTSYQELKPYSSSIWFNDTDIEGEF